MPRTVPAAVDSSRNDGNFSIIRAFHLSENLKREREQRIAGQNRIAVTEDFVAGGDAAAQIVVIERGQVVVNQRIVWINSSAEAQDSTPAGKSRYRFGRGHAQDGTKCAFPPRTGL